MELEEITPVILTFNEEPNIGRTLAGLRDFPTVVVVDSGSDDDTLNIAMQHPNVRVFTRDFDTHASQWNFATSLAPTAWVLSLDADYGLDASFRSELQTLDSDAHHAAYFAPFRYVVLGRPLRRTILPPRAVLFDTNRCTYVDDGHTQRLSFPGTPGQIVSAIDHDDRKSLVRWLWAQDKYASLESAKLASVDRLSGVDRLRRRKWIAPLAVFVHVLFVTGSIRDGRRGLYYAHQRMIAEAILSLRLIEDELGDR